MTVMINPFDTSGYSLAEMTNAIQIIPNLYTRLGQMGLFKFEGVTQRTVMIEMANGVLNLLPTVPWGGAATVANRDTRAIRNFSIPHIPHNDYITPNDFAGIRGFGQADAADPLAVLMTRKLSRLRAKHAATREYMEINALKGVVKDGAGTTLYSYFTEFGVSQNSNDFLFGTTTTAIQSVCRAVSRTIEVNLKGETMNGVLALCSPGFFDKLITHPTVVSAYQYYTNNAALQPLRDDVRRAFQFGGILFSEYNATVTLSTGTTDTLVPANEAIAFPLGTTDTFATYGAPADLLETVNTYGQELYARQLARPDGKAIDIMSEANLLPINKRPELSLRLYSSN